MPEEEKREEKQQVITEPPLVAERSQMPTPPHAAVQVTKETSHTKMRFLSAALLIIVSAGAGFGGGWLGTRNSNTNQTIQKQQVVLESQGKLINSIASNVGPSVVSVNVTTQARSSGGLSSYFGYPDTTEQQSAGTGIIIDKSGLIITNRHVVPAGATKVSVTLSDGTQLDDVEVIGRTSESDPLDVAFLKVKDTKGKTLTAAKIGDSSKVGVGDTVVAIGNALGQFQNTVTSGIISGHGRNIQAGSSGGNDTEDLQNLFQTDAAINEGNSGGPLMNLNGEVIGINTAVASGDAQNIGFAIPINDVKGVIQSVMEKGKLERPYIGLVFVTVTADLAKTYNLKTQEGAYIPPEAVVGRQSVISGGPADKAGIKAGDVITKVNDQKLDENNTLTSVLGRQKVGDTVQITFLRDGKEQVAKVTLESVPDTTTQQ